MAETASGSSNTYAGGINFSSTMGGAGGGTLNFDLPLAAVGAMQDRALSFTAANSERNRGFLTGAMATTSAQVTRTGDASIDYLNRGLGTVRTGNLETGKAVQDINQQSGMFAMFRSLFAAQASKGSGGGCFITTAICDAEGKADDCDELQTLRKFRDEVMLKDERLAPLVAEYYEIAPRIVAAINKGSAPKDVFLMLRMQYLDNAIAAVKAGDIDVAVGEYIQMVAVARQIAGL